MGGKQGFGPYPGVFVDVFDDRPGNGDTIVGAGSAAQLVEEDQAPVRNIVKDTGCLRHLYHKGGFARRNIIGCAYPGKYLIDVPDACRFGRHVRSHLRQQHNQRRLSEQGRFTRHVWTGNHDDLLFVVVECQVVGNVLFADRELLFDHRMTPAFDLKQIAVVHIRAGVFVLNCHCGERAQTVDLGRQAGIELNGLVIFCQRIDQIVEKGGFERQNTLFSPQNFGLILFQLLRNITFRIDQRLLADPFVRDFVLVHVAHLDEIAENIVVGDLQRRDAGADTLPLL